MTDKNTIIRHHLLEIILWPMTDGTFKKIYNSADRLRELGIYDDFKMTIPMTSSEHVILHNKNRPEGFYKVVGKSISKAKKGKPGHNKGTKMSDEARKHLSELRKGRKLCEEHKLKVKESANLLAEKKVRLYNEYRASGGTLLWNEFQKQFRIRLNEECGN